MVYVWAIAGPWATNAQQRTNADKDKQRRMINSFLGGVGAGGVRNSTIRRIRNGRQRLNILQNRCELLSRVERMKVAPNWHRFCLITS
jgi:hypothetical protein